jgi:UDP-hydrolysing UDP-N-acetyl-D-glucosamine 2-epimerase
MKRRVCFVVNSRANYARIKTAILACLNHKDLETFVIVGASGVLYRFGNVAELIEADGIKIESKLYTVVEGNDPIAMAKTTGLSLIDLAQEFHRIRPSVVVTVADRYETIATAIAASYMNIPVAHTQGGEITGSIDESVRHAITKLSHIHFPATKNAAEVLRKLGESPDKIFWVGCPALDLAHEVPHESIDSVMRRYHGVGNSLDFSKPFILVSQHPVTTEFMDARQQIEQTLQAVLASKIQAIWLWPNVDSGSDALSKRIREFREEHSDAPMHFYRNFSSEDYVNILREATCIVGNSSSGIREASFLGTPSVNIGSRQNGRDRAPNVMDVGYNASEIEAAIQAQARNGRFESSEIFGDGFAGEKMAEILASVSLGVDKKLNINA